MKFLYEILGIDRNCVTQKLTDIQTFSKKYSNLGQGMTKPGNSQEKCSRKFSNIFIHYLILKFSRTHIPNISTQLSTQMLDKSF